MASRLVRQADGRTPRGAERVGHVAGKAPERGPEPELVGRIVREVEAVYFADDLMMLDPGHDVAARSVARLQEVRGFASFAICRYPDRRRKPVGCVDKEIVDLGGDAQNS